MPTCKVAEDGEIHYEVHGAGPPVLLISGLGGAKGWWVPQLETFSKRYKVVLHDHRGTGLSSRNRMKYSVPLLARDVIGLMDHLKIEAAHLVGHSTGTAITQEIALNHPKRILSATMSAGWPRADMLFQRAFEIRKALLVNSGVETYVKSGPMFMYPPNWMAQNWEAMMSAEPAAIASFPPPEVMLSRIDAICAYSPGEALRKIACPTLVICAKDDLLTPLYYSEEMAKLIPGAAAHYVATGGHAYTQTRAAEFNRVVPAFIDRHV